MFIVKNSTAATRKIWSRGADGNLELHHLAPGDEKTLDVDKNDPALAGLTLTKAKPSARPAF